MNNINIQVDDEEFFSIARSLENKHAIFYQFWQIGKPNFTTDIFTAGVSFDKKGNVILFSFNPYFWKSLDDYTRRFVICHEMLHIILNHGIRIRDASKMNSAAINMCLDVVVNHLLINKFGFHRPSLKGIPQTFIDEFSKDPSFPPPGMTTVIPKTYNDYRDYCWVDTCLDPKSNEELNKIVRGKLPPDDMSFEYYYKLLPKQEMKVNMDISMGNGGGGSQSSFDDHSGLSDIGDLNEKMKDVNDKLSESEKEEIKEMIEEHFQENTESKEKDPRLSQSAGQGEGDIWTFEHIKNVKKKNKWEKVIKKWADRRIKHVFRDVEQWPRQHPRFSMLPKEFFIPTELEIYDPNFEEDRLKVWFVIDNSGSCFGLFPRFAKAAFSLPPSRFDVRLWSFDTVMREIVTEKGGIKALGCGGTSFACIERKIQEVIHQDKIDHPSAVWVLTDGYDFVMKGSELKPQMPEKWYWFLTTDYKNAIPKKCIELGHVYSLKDFE